VTLANGQTITIEVGKTTGTVTTTAPNDALNGHEPLTNSITGVGGNYENLVADKTPVSTTVTDTVDTTNLSLSATLGERRRPDHLHRDPDQRRRLAGDRDPEQRRGDHHRSRQTTGTVTVPAPAMTSTKTPAPLKATIKARPVATSKTWYQHTPADHRHRHHRHLHRVADRDLGG
jgi:surface adhesion protein